MAANTMASSTEPLHEMIDYNFLPAGRFYVAYIIFHCTHLLSMVGSGTILYLILNDKKRRNETYHRIVFAMSSVDFLCLFINQFQPYASPRSTNLPLAFGNETTCTLLGFNVVVSFTISLYYNALLNVYFLLTIRYNKRETAVKRLLEPYGHLIAIAVPLINGLAGLCFRIFNPDLIFGGCAAAMYPVDCVLHPDDFECERGSAVPYFAPLHFGMITTAAAVGLFSTWLVYWTVRQRTQRAARFVFRGSSQCRAQQQRVEAVAKQALWYSVAFLNTLIVEFVFIGTTVVYYDFKSITNESLAKDNVLYGLFLYTYTAFALQGFFNWIIYVRPRFLPWRDAYPENGRWWAYCQVLKGGATPVTCRTQHWLAVDSPSAEFCRGPHKSPTDPTEESGFEESQREFRPETAPAKRRGAITMAVKENKVIIQKTDLLVLNEESESSDEEVSIPELPSRQSTDIESTESSEQQDATSANLPEQ